MLDPSHVSNTFGPTSRQKPSINRTNQSSIILDFHSNNAQQFSFCFPPKCVNHIFTVCNEVAKVMFLQVSVCPQGVGVSASMHGGIHTPSPGADIPPEQIPPGADSPRDGHCCGRYASYWNAFLFHARFILSS